MAATHPSAEDREKHGMKDSKFPCATATQCIHAINLRHNGKGVSASAVLSHVMTEAGKLKSSGKISPAAYERIKNKVSEARSSDKGSSQEGSKE